MAMEGMPDPAATGSGGDGAREDSGAGAEREESSGQPHNFMRDYGPRLIDQGYHIVPLMPGAKKPGECVAGRWRPQSNWPRFAKRQPTELEMDHFCNKWTGTGVGIMCGSDINPVLGLDIDLPEQEWAEGCQDMAFRDLGETPAVRVGMAPKRLLVYRAKGVIKPVKRHPLECLSVGNQFVAYGIHPSVGRPYQWIMDDLVDVHVCDLPEVTEADVKTFMEKAFGIIPPELRQRSLGPDLSEDTFRGASGDQKGTFDAVASALKFIRNNDLGYDSWVKICFAVKGALGEAGRDLFMAWSATSTKDVPKTTLQCWRSAKPERIGAGTIYWYAGIEGWVPEPGVFLNPGAEQASRTADELIANLRNKKKMNDSRNDFGGREEPRQDHEDERREQPDGDQEQRRQSDTSGWPEPVPLQADLDRCQPYPLHALPPIMRNAVTKFAEFGQQPVPMLATSALAVASLVCQGHADVGRDAGLTGPCSLSTLDVADSGERKSFADKILSREPRAWEAIKRSDMAPDIREARARRLNWEAKIAGLRGEIRKVIPNANKEGSISDLFRNDLAKLEAEILALESNPPAMPTEPRMFLEDVTQEALALQLQNGWPSTSIWSDEGGMVIGSAGMSEESALRMLSFYNRLWDGNSTFVARVSRANTEVKGRRVTVRLMVQPAVASRLFGMQNGIARHNGALARFLICYPESTAGERAYRRVEAGAVELIAWDRALERILDRDLPIKDGADASMELAPPVIHLDDAAHQVWVDYFDDVEKKIRPAGEFAGIKDFASKSAEQAARIACICHVLRHGPSGRIDTKTIESACELAWWYLHEARRVMGSTISPELIADARVLFDWLRQQKAAPSLKDILRLGPYRLRSARRRDGACQLLEQHHLVRRIMVDGSTRIILSPRHEEVA